MDYPPFYKTRMGEKFYCKTVPDLIRAVEQLADVLDRVLARQEPEQREKGEQD